jgi:hypothetical protein
MRATLLVLHASIWITMQLYHREKQATTVRWTDLSPKLEESETLGGHIRLYTCKCGNVLRR